MRRRNGGIGKYIIIIIIIVVVVLFAIKNLFGSNTKKYTNYVKKYEEALTSYLSKDNNADKQSYDFDEVTKILIDNGYLDEYEDSTVNISGDTITVNNSNGNISFYNYNNTTTLENKFEIKFTKNEKIYTCTKNKCE